MKLKFISIIVLFFFANIFISGRESGKKIKTFTLSVKYENNKDYKNAIKEIEKIYTDFKDDYLVNLRLGWLYYLNSKQDKSIKYYNEAVRLSNNSIEGLLGLTIPYSAKEKWDKVKDIYEQILSIDPANYTANLRLGQIYLNRKDYLNAKKMFTNVYNNYPGDYLACLYLGWTYYYLGSNSKAKELFTDTLILDPGNISATKGLELLKWKI